MGFFGKLFRRTTDTVTPPATTPATATPDATPVAEAVPVVDAERASPATEEKDKEKQPQKIDVVFSVDCTASMGPYIEAAQASCTEIMHRLVAAESCDARFGLVAYRDHAPQDHTFVTRTFEFTADAASFQRNVDWMRPQGGGDGPEAVAAALAACAQMPWRPDATKVVVHIADAPPHGLGERGDGFPDGCPDGHDPLLTATEMLQRAIACYTVGCEPALGEYRYARDFMVTLAEKTGGQAVTLESAALLGSVLLGGAMEELGLERLMRDVADEAAAAASAGGGGGELDEEEILERVTRTMQAKGARCSTLRHNAKIVAPHAAKLKASPGLAAWRSELPAAAEEDAFRSSFGGAPTPRRARRSCGAPAGGLGAFRKKKSKAAGPASAPAALFDESLDTLGSLEERESGARAEYESRGATECVSEEMLISKEQISRCLTKSKARGMY